MTGVEGAGGTRFFPADDLLADEMAGSVESGRRRRLCRWLPDGVPHRPADSSNGVSSTVWWQWLLPSGSSSLVGDCTTHRACWIHPEKNNKIGSENLHIDAEANKMLFNLQARSDASVNVLPSFPMWCAEGYGPNQYIASSIKNGYTWTVTKINQTCCLATCSL